MFDPRIEKLVRLLVLFPGHKGRGRASAATSTSRPPAGAVHAEAIKAGAHVTYYMLGFA